MAKETTTPSTPTRRRTKAKDQGDYIPQDWGEHPDDTADVTHARTTPPTGWEHPSGVEPG